MLNKKGKRNRMKKKIYQDEVLYTLAWSPVYQFDKYSITKIIPELAGIVAVMEKHSEETYHYMLFYSCWRDGMRLGLKNLFDPIFTRHPDLAKAMEGRQLWYKYTVVDSNPFDLQDILWWLIQSYEQELNDIKNYEHSKRYRNIYVREMVLDKETVVERLPKYGI